MVNTFFSKLGDYISPGDRVAELYHGEKDDILSALSDIVGENGMVYGVDLHNPFRSFKYRKYYKHMRDLRKRHNVKLIKAKIPPIPLEVSNLDAIVIREFLWTQEYVKGRYKDYINEAVEDPIIYIEMNRVLNNQGHLILHLNPTDEKKEKDGKGNYHQIIKRQFPDFKKKFHKRNMLVYQKLK